MFIEPTFFTTCFHCTKKQESQKNANEDENWAKKGRKKTIKQKIKVNFNEKNTFTPCSEYDDCPGPINLQYFLWGEGDVQ